MKQNGSAVTSPGTAQALQLDLDHAGCIVNAFAAGAAQWERLGFQLTPVSPQRGAVPGREGFHPWATANRCAILRNTYLELIGVVDSAAFNPWARFIAKNEGLHILALRCGDADSAHAILSTRTDALQPPVPRERVLDVDGEPRAMRFRNIFSRDEAWPEARYLVIEHQTPAFLWQPRYQWHENGACDLVAVTFVADDPSMFIPRLTALGAAIVSIDDAAISAQLPGRGSINIMSSTLFARAYGYAPRSGLQAIAVSFSDLGRTLELCKNRGVEVATSRDGQWIAPRDANGFVLHLVQDNGLS
ncbi:MAG: VOC family protein [Betaproteobacteria bacterium]